MDALASLRTAIAPGMPVDLLAEARKLRPIANAEIDQLRPDIGLGRTGEVGGGRSFESLLGDVVEEVNDKQLASAGALRGLLSGENVPLHRVIIAAEEASISFQLMVEVRNKLLEAYQELMRMQV